MKVLVTGCNGYIGAHTVKQLAEYGHEVYGVDYNMNGNDIIKYLADDFVFPQNINLIERKCFPAFEFDTIVHLAALIKVGESVEMPTEYYITNTIGTYKVLSHITHDKFIFASTGAAFGGESPYAVSKRCAEDIIKQKSDNYTIFRFFNVAGNGDFKNFNKDGLFECLHNTTDTFTINGGDYDTKDGTPIRDYIHVEDIATAICNAVNQPAAMTNYECLGYGKDYSVLEVAETYKRVNNKNFDIIIGNRRSGDLASSSVPSVSKFVEQNYTLEEIVK